MFISPDMRLFDTRPSPETTREQRGGRAYSLYLLASIPHTFLRETLIVIDVVSLVFAFLLLFSFSAQHASLMTMLGAEMCFLASLIMLFLARNSTHFMVVFVYDAALLVLNVLFNVLFQGHWGNFGLFALCGYTCYRFPLPWAWPVVVTSCLALAGTNGLQLFFLTGHLNNSEALMPCFLITLFLCWHGWTRRGRDLLVLQLQETQQKLRREMARTEEIATTRERTRIARDIHDVLAHSLTLLSVQVQAARQLLHQQPELVSAKLDDIAALLRESIAESRRVVGLLRATASFSTVQGDVGATLLNVMDRFGERTGIRCLFKEMGTPQSVNDRLGETLQYVLREALTNAHRHASAHTVWTELHWFDTQVRLQIHDDGQGTNSGQGQARENGGHHGLLGMRERASALNGELIIESQTEERGFRILLILPLTKDPRTSFTQEIACERA